MPKSRSRKKKPFQTPPSYKNKTYTKTDSMGRECLYNGKHKFVRFIKDYELDEDKIMKAKFGNR